MTDVAAAVEVVIGHDHGKFRFAKHMIWILNLNSFYSERRRRSYSRSRSRSRSAASKSRSRTPASRSASPRAGSRSDSRD